MSGTPRVPAPRIPDFEVSRPTGGLDDRPASCCSEQTAIAPGVLYRLHHPSFDQGLRASNDELAALAERQPDHVVNFRDRRPSSCRESGGPVIPSADRLVATWSGWDRSALGGRRHQDMVFSAIRARRLGSALLGDRP